MTLELVLTIVFGVLAIVGAFVTYYLYIKQKVTAAIAGEIDNEEGIAEENGRVKEEKKAEVISQLKKLIPAIVRPFISDAMLDSLVQASFDKIESYAKKQAEKKALNNSDKDEVKTDEIS